MVTIDGTLDLIGSLNAEYHNNASFLINRVTSIGIRRAQRQANLFEPVWTRLNNQDYLHGYPVNTQPQCPSLPLVPAPSSLGISGRATSSGTVGEMGSASKFLTSPSHLRVRLRSWLIAGQMAASAVLKQIQSYNCHS